MSNIKNMTNAEKCVAYITSKGCSNVGSLHGEVFFKSPMGEMYFLDKEEVIFRARHYEDEQEDMK